AHSGVPAGAVGGRGGADGPERCGGVRADACDRIHRHRDRHHRGQGAGNAADVSQNQSRCEAGGASMTFKECMDLIAVFIMPLLIVGLPVYGLIRRVRVYEKFVEGAKDGFTTAVWIIPYMVAILFTIGMFRASGAMDFLQDGLRRPLSWIGMPPEVLP